jgi:hypothetical protein
MEGFSDMKQILFIFTSILLIFTLSGCNASPNKREVANSQKQQPETVITPEVNTVQTDKPEASVTTPEPSAELTPEPEPDEPIIYDYTRNAEGDKLFANFLETTKNTRSSEYDRFWDNEGGTNIARWNGNDIKGKFIKNNICTQEYWDIYLAGGLTPFERFCWEQLYGDFINTARGGDPSFVFKDEETFLERHSFYHFSKFIGNYVKDAVDNELIKDTYKALILFP